MSLLPIADADFDRRWAEWQERGRVHSSLVNTRLRIALPVAALIIVAGYLFLVR